MSSLSLISLWAGEMYCQIQNLPILKKMVFSHLLSTVFKGSFAIYRSKKRPGQQGCLLLLGLSLLSLPLSSSPTIEIMGMMETARKAKQGRHLVKFDSSSYIDWTEGKIYVSVRRPLYGTRNIHSLSQAEHQPSLSEIRSKARQQAQEEAYLKLASLAYNVCLDSEALIKDRMQQDQNLQQRMGNLPSRFHIESRRTGGDYVNLKLSLPFWGQKGLYALIAADTYSKRLPLPRLEAHDPSLFISSVIFIVQGTRNFQSSLQPRLYSREGLLFYSPEIASPHYAVQRGLAVYYTSLEKARKDPRAGQESYIAYTAALRGTKQSDFVVHDQDLTAILGSPSGRRALQQARVILVVPSSAADKKEN